MPSVIVGAHLTSIQTVDVMKIVASTATVHIQSRSVHANLVIGELRQTVRRRLALRSVRQGRLVRLKMIAKFADVCTTIVEYFVTYPAAKGNVYW